MHQPIEDESSNFIAVRKILPTSATIDAPLSNLLYAEFQNGTGGQVDFQRPNYYELFDMQKDNWQTRNIYEATKQSAPAAVEALHNEVQAWLRCKGPTCP